MKRTSKSCNVICEKINEREAGNEIYSETLNEKELNETET